MPLSESRRGTLMVVAGALTFSTQPYFALALKPYHVSAWTQVAARLLVSAIVFAIVRRRIKRKNPHLNATLPLPHLFVSGLIFLAVFSSYLLSIALDTPPAKAVLLIFFYPVIVIILGRLLFHEPLTKRRIFAVACGAAGIAMTLEFWQVEGLISLHNGDFFALLNSFFAATMVIFGRYAGRQNGVSPAYTLSRSFGFSVGWMLLFAAVYGLLSGPESVVEQFRFDPDAAPLLLLAGLAFIGTVLGYMLLYEGLRFISSGTASILTFVEPLGVIIFGFFLVETRLGPWQLAGGTAILLAGLVAAHRHNE